MKTRMRGDWGVSPMREAKVLLGVLKQEGLAGKGLIEAFEAHAPRLLGYKREDFGKLYFQQSGKELSDYILIQRADKALRGGELGREADVLRRLLQKSR